MESEKKRRREQQGAVTLLGQESLQMRKTHRHREREERDGTKKKHQRATHDTNPWTEMGRQLRGETEGARYWL